MSNSFGRNCFSQVKRWRCWVPVQAGLLSSLYFPDKYAQIAAARPCLVSCLLSITFSLSRYSSLQPGLFSLSGILTPNFSSVSAFGALLTASWYTREMLSILAVSAAVPTLGTEASAAATERPASRRRDCLFRRPSNEDILRLLPHYFCNRSHHLRRNHACLDDVFVGTKFFGFVLFGFVALVCECN